MNIKKSVNPLLLLCSIMMPIIVLLVTGSYATFGISLIIFVTLFSAIVIREWRDAYYLVNTFFVTYCAYTLFAILHYNQIADNELDSMLDEVRYFIPFVDNIIAENISFDRLWVKSLQYNYYGEHSGYLFYIGSFAVFGKNCLGDYNVMQLLLSSVLLGCLYSMLLFKTILLYTDSRTAYKYTVFYMLCTPIVMSSFVVLRDLFVSFIFLIGIYIILTNKPFIKGGLILLFSFFVLTLLRLEHALFFTLIIAIFIYRKLQRHKVIAISLFVICAICSVTVIHSMFMTMSDTVSTYNEYTKGHANAAGLAMKLLSLPSPIKEVACTLFSQIFPIPPWASLIEGIKSFPDFVFSALSMIKTICWFYIVFSTIKWLYVSYNNIKSYNLGLLLIATILLIVVCSTEYYESRRMMCMYPILYLIFILLRERSTKKQIRDTNYQYVALYSFTLLAYYVVV